MSFPPQYRIWDKRLGEILYQHFLRRRSEIHFLASRHNEERVRSNELRPKKLIPLKRSARPEKSRTPNLTPVWYFPGCTATSLSPHRYPHDFSSLVSPKILLSGVRCEIPIIRSPRHGSVRKAYFPRKLVTTSTFPRTQSPFVMLTDLPRILKVSGARVKGEKSSSTLNDGCSVYQPSLLIRGCLHNFASSVGR